MKLTSWSDAAWAGGPSMHFRGYDARRCSFRVCVFSRVIPTDSSAMQPARGSRGAVIIHEGDVVRGGSLAEAPLDRAQQRRIDDVVPKRSDELHVQPAEQAPMLHVHRHLRGRGTPYSKPLSQKQ